MFGGDTHIVFGKIYFAQFQAVGEHHAIERRRRTAVRCGRRCSTRTGRSWGFHYNVIGIDPDFRADNGFVPRTGFVQPSTANRFTLVRQTGRRCSSASMCSSTVNALWHYDDFFCGKRLLEDHRRPMMQLTLRGGWSVGMSRRGSSSYAFDPARYANLYVPAVAGGAPTPFAPSDRIETLTSGFSVVDAAVPQVARHPSGTTLGNDVDFLETSRVRRLDYNARSICVRASGCASARRT